MQLKGFEPYVLKNKLFHFKNKDIVSTEQHSATTLLEYPKSFFSHEINLLYSKVLKDSEKLNKKDEEYKNRSCDAEARREFK
jgi:hypothetical protein